ncbi:MAG TPA: 2-oxoacid:acceptor oxidoreductase family protein [candidate division Zixibacteria bacterium]|nr:2-oxoacid:acceptor oxidoreductase family protein [candidate division Zixibacteria bacterium]
MKQYEVLFAGFGGQGIMTAGQLLAYAGIAEGKQVAWIPSYGPEMRGGTAYCMVVISDTRIGSPIISNPRCAVVFNRPSFDKFVPRIKPQGLSIVNSSLIDVTTDRDDITELLVPANDIAMKIGNPKAANIAVLGAFIGATEVVGYDTIKDTIKLKLGKKKEALPVNMKALEEGYKLSREVLGRKVKA